MVAAVYRHQFLVTLLAGLAGAAIGAAPAFAAGAPTLPSEPPPSVEQYVEVFPTAGGPTVGASKAVKLPKRTAKRIDKNGGVSAGQLKAVLTSPVYGVATRSAPKPVAKRDEGNVNPKGSAPVFPTGDLEPRSSLSSVVTSDPGRTALFWLVLAAATLIPIAIRVSSRGERDRASS